MKETKTLIKGIIYDDPNLVEEESYLTACQLYVASQSIDLIDYSLRKNIVEGYIPTLPEFYTSECINVIAKDNMIIPKNLIGDPKLYDSLQNINIGNKLLLNNFIDVTSERNGNIQEENNIADDKGIIVTIVKDGIVNEEVFENKKDAATYLIEKHLEMFGDFNKNKDVLLKGLADIENVA